MAALEGDEGSVEEIGRTLEEEALRIQEVCFVTLNISAIFN